jgi:YVTN family beta-propeller protein
VLRDSIPLADAQDVAVGKDGKRLYASVINSRDVAVIDTTTRKVIRSITLSRNPGGLAVSRDGRHLYVDSYDGSTLFIIDTKTDKVVGPPILLPG